MFTLLITNLLLLLSGVTLVYLQHKKPAEYKLFLLIINGIAYFASLVYLIIT